MQKARLFDAKLCMKFGEEGIRTAHLQELRQCDEEKRSDGDDDGRARIERVHLRPEAGSEVWVLDLSNSRSIDVPNAALPNVS